MTSSGVPVGDTTLLQRLKELDEKATRVPWRAYRTRDAWHVDREKASVVCEITGTVDAPRVAEDAELIASLRNALPAVVTLIEAAQRLADRSGCQDPASDEPLYGLDGGDYWKLRQALAPFVGEATQ